MRNPPGWHSTTALAMLLAAAPALSQQGAPRIGYAYPAGGQQGSTVEVTVGGQFLDNPKLVILSGEGVQAGVIEHKKPMTPNQFNKLREELQALMEKRAAAANEQAGGGRPAGAAFSPEDDKKIAELRVKIATFIRRPANPAIAETVTLRVSIAAGAPPGRRELRLLTAAGLTNPLAFWVGQLPEFSRKAAQVQSDVPAGLAARFRGAARQKPPAEALRVTLPAVINGQIMPGTVDRFRFTASKGQRLVAAAQARELMPYISDAVPGWFQAVLAIYDAKGRELAYSDDYRFHPDPVLTYEIPEDGEYLLEIKDAIYRGREDFVYRIAVGELPFITDVFPLGGKAGVRSTVEVTGWNLPQAQLIPDTRTAGVHPVTLRKGELVSNPVPFAVDTLPEQLEREPNDVARGARAMKLPVIVNGRIGKPGDVDVFRFEGRAGEEIVAEVFARRLGSPLDSLLRLADAQGREAAVNDDYEDRGSGLLTHHADSRIIYKLPKTGPYYLHLSGRQGKGGAGYAYRLKIARPQPDFELRVVPASINARPGSTVPVTVYALRKDGFAGDIALKLKDAPQGFALSGAWVPGNRDHVRLTLSVPPRRAETPFRLILEGRAGIQGKDVRRLAVPAEDMMQAFAYRHLVPAAEWLIQLNGPARQRIPWKIAERDPVKLPAGGAAPVQVFLPAGRYSSLVELSLNEPPEGISIDGVSWAATGPSLMLRADAGKVKPGLKGNLIVEAFMERVPNPGEKKQKANRRMPLGVLPAIAFEVVGK